MSIFNNHPLILFFLIPLLFPAQLYAQGNSSHETLDLTSSPIGYLSLIFFLIAYLFVMTEEFTRLRKSKPVILATGIIWSMIGWVYMQHGLSDMAENAVRHNLLEYAELMLFLLVAMTYINNLNSG